MIESSNHKSELLLSICITTFNRAKFIGATLDSIVMQLTDDCEVVIVDGGSTDETEQVVSDFVHRFENLRYFKQAINQGIDRDYDRSVQLSCGRYCWFMSDDDLLKRGAIAKVLSALEADLSLVLVNSERLDLSMSTVLLSRTRDIDDDIVYIPNQMDALFSENISLLIYIGSVVIQRSIWTTRNRANYYGTLLVHIGVIFQELLPSPALVIAQPLVSYRDGNSRSFWSKMFEIFWIKFPAMVSTFAVSDQTKGTYSVGLRGISPLFYYRAMGWYGFYEYRRWVLQNSSSIRQRLVPFLIAIAPGTLTNFLYLMIVRSRPTRGRDVIALQLRMSRFYFRNSRIPWFRRPSN